MPQLLTDPAHWHLRALEARRLAQQLDDPKAKAAKLEMAEQRGGEIKAAYALLGDVDLVAIVELPDTARAMQTSAALSKLLGADFTTAPAVTADEFDKLMAVI